MEENKRRIVHMDLDSFFVSVERKLNPELNGKPVIIGGTSGRGVVSSCSYEARKFGVTSAMPGARARQLCPQGIFIKGNMQLYSENSRLVTQIIEDAAPLVEKASIDEHYLDITGMDKYICDSFTWTKQLRQKIIKESGLPISFGLSTNKLVSKIATTESKPNGELFIEPGKEKAFLAPMDVSKIPGVGDKTYMTLCNLGLQKIATIQNMSPEKLQGLIGDYGKSLWRRANGISDSEVETTWEQKSMSTERTFHADTNDKKFLKELLVKMVEELGFDLRRSEKAAGSVAIKIRHSNFETHTFQCRVPYTSSDHILLQKVNELFDKNYDSRVMVRLLGVKFSSLVEGTIQMDLFDDTAEMINLYQSLDKIKLRFGDKAVMRSVGVNPPDKTKKEN
ncbi:MAG: DNA polymerase IV [Bacteroidota bacterium]